MTRSKKRVPDDARELAEALSFSVPDDIGREHRYVREVAEILGRLLPTSTPLDERRLLIEVGATELLLLRARFEADE